MIGSGAEEILDDGLKEDEGKRGVFISEVIEIPEMPLQASLGIYHLHNQ